MLSCFSRVRLCATPQTAAHQALPSLGFSSQEHWSGLPFPSPMHESEVAQSCPTLSNPMDCSPPVSSIHEILQARVLAWASISTRPHSKESTSKAGDAGDIRDSGSIPGWGRSPGGGCGNSLQYSCLEISKDRGAWPAIVHGITKGWT